VPKDLVVFGHHQSLKLIAITDEDCEAIKGDGLYIEGQPSYLYAGDMEGKVIEGFFDNLKITVDDDTYEIEIPDDTDPIEVRGKTFLVATSDNKMWFKGQIDGDFDPDEIQVAVQCFDFDEDSETYTFASISYPGVELEEDERDPVHEGFMLIDAEEGIIELEVEDDDNGFFIKRAD
jgi:hypothetical protein